MALITPSQRFAALLSAKTLLVGGENTTLFSKSSPPAPNPTPMIRIAEYILTGLDYRDTDPATAGDAHYSGYPEDPAEDPAEETAKDPAEETAEETAKDPAEDDGPLVMTPKEWESIVSAAAPHGDRGVLVMPPETGDSPLIPDGKVDWNRLGREGDL